MRMNKLPEGVPENLSALLNTMRNDFPSLLENNLVGIYLWGSLTYQAFDERCSDIDCIVVTRSEINEREFSKLEDWFKGSLKKNPWTGKLDNRTIRHYAVGQTGRRNCSGSYETMPE